MSDLPRILVVDDHSEIRKSVTSYLERNGMRASAAENAVEMDARLAEAHFDLIVLDVMMPGEDGLSACTRLRKEGHIPILMLTALGDDEDRIAGLDGGADDYLAKPFNPKELVARINAILRRTQLIPKPNGFAGKTLKFAHLKLDFDGRTLIDQGGSRTQLTSGELKLLTLFLQRPRTVIGRDELLKLSTGRVAGPLDRTIDNQVSRLRRKMEEDVLRPKIIATVRHGGYSLSCDVEICE
ncbi:MAG: DNA-binding response regulator [Hyphomonas sp. 34-62-18]|uniref:response regulator n=1 Tax=Pseudosulfitobacter pseudonitzschiae TaxID=1402135 RepID=UPI000BD39C7F|nr:response regulator [Hyphomonas sp. 34-62-18]OZB18576.1 MAG: DNA-binding response regulator [Hyphomonas sp. 34-62-18]